MKKLLLGLLLLGFVLLAGCGEVVEDVSLDEPRGGNTLDKEISQMTDEEILENFPDDLDNALADLDSVE
jgi:hypothetical protein